MKYPSWLMAATLTLSTNALADMLYTPTLWPVAPDRLACNLTNVSEVARKVGVRIISNGKILLESGEVELAPRHTTDHSVEGLAEGGPIYCEFTVEGSKEAYRGVAKLFHGKNAPNETDFVAVPAY